MNSVQPNPTNNHARLLLCNSRSSSARNSFSCETPHLVRSTSAYEQPEMKNPMHSRQCDHHDSTTDQCRQSLYSNKRLAKAVEDFSQQEKMLSSKSFDFNEDSLIFDNIHPCQS
jgi:hypothetical protein